MKSALISRRVCSIRQKIRGVNIMGYYIGIDLGTSAVKMLLMDANGDIIKSIAKEYPIYFRKMVGQNKILKIGGMLLKQVYKK